MSDLELAVIVALATVLGAGVGTLGSVVITGRIEDRRAEREEARETSASKAAARVLYADLFRAEWTLNTSLLHQSWWPAHVQLAPRVAEAERLALAGRLPADHWYVTLMASTALEVADIDRSMAPPDLPGQVPSMSDARLTETKEIRTKVRIARAALAEFGGFSALHDEAASRPIAGLDDEAARPA